MIFKEKAVIITGGASGMGLLAGQCFAKEGANIVLVDVDESAAKEKAEQICSDGGRAIGVGADVRNYSQVSAAVEAAVKEFSTVDVMINCAGGAETRIFKTSGADFKDIPIEVFDWGLDVNLKGQFYFDHAVMKYMAEQKSGVIINIGSITGEEGSASAVAYSTAKSAAMNGLTKSVALCGAKYNVRCVCISPGPVLTRQAMANMKTAMGRAAEPQEIVDLMMYVASDKGAFMTGINILIDGGRNIIHNKG